MKSFEDIQESWLSQPVNEKGVVPDLRVVQSKWQKRQRKLLNSNLRMTVGFAVAMGVIGWVYLSFHGKYGWAFDVSIAIVYLLMFVFLWVAWRSYGFRKESFEDSSVECIDYQVRKLEWQRKTLTTYVWVYNLLLWMALCLYSLEITKNASVWFTVAAIGAITVYIGGISLWVRLVRQKKQVRGIDEMVGELRGMRERIGG